MTEFLGNKGENADDAERTRKDLLDGPMPGYRRLTDEEERALDAHERATLDALAAHYGGDEERGIDSHIILAEE